jgi:hypothetical protein
MPRPSNPAARLVLDGQRTCLANQSIGGQIHAAIFASKIHDRLLRPLLAISHQRRERHCKPSTITLLSRSSRPASYRTPPENSRHLQAYCVVTNSLHPRKGAARRLARGLANPSSAEDISSAATLAPWPPGVRA